MRRHPVRDARRGGEQRAGIAVPRRRQDIGGRPALDDAAAAQHDDLVGHVGDHAQIVRDHDDGQLVVALQPAQQVEHHGLGGHVERRRRLVGNHQRRVADHRHGDNGALAQAARELERIGGPGALGAGEADLAEHFEHALLDALPLRAATMHPQHLGHLLADRVQRRQRAHRLLEDHRDLGSAQCPHLAVLDRQEIKEAAAMPEDRPATGDPGRAWQQADQRFARQRLARPGLAHERQHLAGLDVERDTVDHRRHQPGGAKGDRQVLDGQKRHFPAPARSDRADPRLTVRQAGIRRKPACAGGP